MKEYQSTLTINGYKVSISHIGGNFNYGIYDVLVEKNSEVVYENNRYCYTYISFGATYGEVAREVIHKLNTI